MLKRAFDIVGAACLLIGLSPVMAALAVLIRWRLGSPVLFSQVRPGINGRPFKLRKFRSMTNSRRSDGKLLSDAERLTPLGHWLRATSLDELPELWNVLMGEMSLVGPRPTSFSADTYQLWQTERLDVIPGLTGLWQIIGRGETEFTDRLRLDIAYMQRRCLWLDIQIMFRTISAVFTARGRH